MKCTRCLRGWLSVWACSERLRYLELKTNAYFNWGNYYNMESIVERSICKKSTTLGEFDANCKSETKEPDEVCPGLYDHTICLDSFPPPAVCLPTAQLPTTSVTECCVVHYCWVTACCGVLCAAR